MTFEELEEFHRDVKTLMKKYRSLNEDMEVIKRVLEVEPNERPPFSYQIDGLGIETCVIKVKKIACGSLKGRGVNSGFRLVYAYFQEIPKIVLVELYFKAEQEREDKERILKHFK